MPAGDDVDTKLQDVIDSFNDNNSGKNKAYEIKITTVVYQNVPNVHSPMLQLMDQPQKNNYSSDFNSRSADVVL